MIPNTCQPSGALVRGFLSAVFVTTFATLASPPPVAAAPVYATPDHDQSTEAGGDSRSAAYRAGQTALTEERWADAARAFAGIRTAGGNEADAALYWLAYAEWKRQHKREALEAIRQLRAGYGNSAWVDDAEALEQEIRGGQGGAGVDPDNDDELKLYALDGLMQMEPERAVPVLEKILSGSQSPKVKERALFVLSQSDTPRAREILVGVARTGEPVSLRIHAIRSLGIAGEPEDLQALAALARESNVPFDVRAALVDAYMIAGAEEALLTLAQGDTDPRVRGKAIDALGATDSLAALRRLWSSEKDPVLRGRLLTAFGIAGDVETLARIARDETDPKLRRRAIEGLAIADSPAASRELRQLYGTFTDRRDKESVLQAFMIQDDAATLVELFKSERDPELKKTILRQLSMLDDPAATEVVMGILGAN